jgi:hypothetical protein
MAEHKPDAEDGRRAPGIGGYDSIASRKPPGRLRTNIGQTIIRVRP